MWIAHSNIYKVVVVVVVVDDVVVKYNLDTLLFEDKIAKGFNLLMHACLHTVGEKTGGRGAIASHFSSGG